MQTILSLLDTPAFGGAEQYLLSHLYELQKLPKTMVVLATNLSAVKKRVVEDGNLITVINLPYRLDAIGNWKGFVKYLVQAPIALVWFLMLLRKLSQKSDEVIVYTPGFSDRMLFSPFVKLFGHRLIWIEFGPVKPFFKRNFGFPKLLYKIGGPFPDRVVTISEHVKKTIIENKVISEEKIVIIYPTTPKISKNELKKIKKAGENWRKDHQLQNKKLITFVGRLASEKEVDLLIKAFKQVVEKHKNAQLVIVGDGPEKEDYTLLVKKLGLTDRTVFTGFVTEEMKQHILATSDVFVFPAAWELEGFGMTTIEAMMLEVPVVTSGAGPQQEIVDDGKTGLYFEPHTTKALAEKISYIISKSAFSQKLAIAGRKKAIALFSNNLVNRIF